MIPGVYVERANHARREVLIVRNEGPVGGPGMREMLRVTAVNARRRERTGSASCRRHDRGGSEDRGQITLYIRLPPPRRVLAANGLNYSASRPPENAAKLRLFALSFFCVVGSRRGEKRHFSRGQDR